MLVVWGGGLPQTAATRLAHVPTSTGGREAARPGQGNKNRPFYTALHKKRRVTPKLLLLRASPQSWGVWGHSLSHTHTHTHTCSEGALVCSSRND